MRHVSQCILYHQTLAYWIILKWNWLFSWINVTKIALFKVKSKVKNSRLPVVLTCLCFLWLHVRTFVTLCFFPKVQGMTVECPWSSPMLPTKIWASMSAGSAPQDSLHSPTCSHMKVKEKKIMTKHELFFLTSFFFFFLSSQWDCHSLISSNDSMWVLIKSCPRTHGRQQMTVFVSPPSCSSCGSVQWRRGCSLLQAAVQRGFLIRPILRRETSHQHSHRKSSFWGGDASTGIPDQDAGRPDSLVSAGTLLCAEGAQLFELRDQQQQRACSEELRSGSGGKW